LVTSGAQQAIDLVARALIDDGDVAVVESPAYLGATQVLQMAGASVAAIASDDHGLDTDALGERVAAGLRPKLIYVVPNFHNPTGVTMSADRRRSLARIADTAGALVIDDDPYGALRFAGASLPAVDSRTVVRVGTVSKVLAPGLRVGWMIGPRWLVDACVRLKQTADLHSSSLSQQVVVELLSDEQWFGEHVASLRELYRTRAFTLIDALRREFADRVVIAPVEGGLFAWVTFTDGTDTDELLARALDHGVAFVPGSAFSAERRHRHSARLCFASLAPSGLREAIARLAEAHRSAERADEIDHADDEPEHDHERTQLLRR
jgi:2-aminoadipate transaminase